MCDDRRIRDAQVGAAVMNKMWIRAKICETISDFNSENIDLSYSQLISQFDSSCHKDVVEVLAIMYDENHIWSTVGVVKWNHCSPKKAPVDISQLTSLCRMIATYAEVSWQPGVSCHE